MKNNRAKFFPLAAVMLTIIFTVAFMGYALSGDAPMVAPAYFSVVPIVVYGSLAVFGIWSAYRIFGLRVSVIMYIIFAVSNLSGLVSFYILNQPSVINVFGIFAMLVGHLGGLVMGVILLFLRPNR